MKLAVKPSRSYDLKVMSLVIPDDIYEAILMAGVEIYFNIDGANLRF